MAAPISQREIEKEADNNITLGRLLRKERSPARAEAVERVLSADLRITQKIERIREIDDQQEDEEVEQVVGRAFVQAMHRKTARIRNSIKTIPRPIAYFPYLLRQRKRICEFAKNSHVLQTSLLPPGIRINSELRTFFVRSLQQWAAELSPQLRPVMEHGWLHLTPVQYNLVRLLKALADKILTFDFVHLNYRDRFLIDRLKRIEILFLMLQYDPQYRDSILHSLQVVYTKQGWEEQQVREVQNLVRRILEENLTLPSLYNCLVGLNIAKFRRILTLEDLMRSGLGEMVSATEFDCSAEVRRRIEEYVDQSLESIKKVHGQLHEVRRLNSYLRYDDQGQLDVRNLRGLYGRAEKGEKPDFDADQGNALLFSQHLFDSFLRLYLPLLNGRVRIRGAGGEEVFTRSFYEVEVSRLAGIVEKLKRGPFHFSNFPLAQYLQVKEGRIGAIGNEMELVQLIDEGIAILADLGKSLARVLSSSLGAAASDAAATDSAASDAAEALSPIIFQGKPYSIPWANLQIEAPGGLEGRSVAEALSDAVSVCFTAGMLFRDRFVYYILSRENRYQSELEAQMRLLRNLLKPDRYESLSVLYH